MRRHSLLPSGQPGEPMLHVMRHRRSARACRHATALPCARQGQGRRSCCLSLRACPRMSRRQPCKPLASRCFALQRALQQEHAELLAGSLTCRSDVKHCTPYECLAHEVSLLAGASGQLADVRMYHIARAMLFAQQTYRGGLA